MVICTFEDGGTGQLRHAVVDGIIYRENKILLAKRALRLIEGGKWGLIGGYMSRDETVTEALAREVLEETGWKIAEPQLLTIRSNPDRPGEDRQNICFVFVAEAIEENGTPDDESDELAWYSMNELPPAVQIAFDHADSIALYQEWLENPAAFPRY